MDKERSSVRDWMPAIELAIVLVTILGSTIPLYLHTDSKMQTEIAAIREDVKAIHEEIKDFHGKMCAIEERNKK